MPRPAHPWLTLEEPFTPEGRHPEVRISVAATGEELGVIHWYAEWEQFVFRPRLGTAWTGPVLRPVVDYLDALTAEVAA